MGRHLINKMFLVVVAAQLTTYIIKAALQQSRDSDQLEERKDTILSSYGPSTR